MTTATTEEDTVSEWTPEQMQSSTEEAEGFKSVVDDPTDPDMGTPDVPDASVPSTDTAETSSTEAAETTTETEVEPPKLAEISDEQFQRLLKSADSLEEIKAAYEQRFNGLGGKIGGIERVLQEFRGSGKKAEVQREHFKELLEDFPEFGEKMLKGLGLTFAEINSVGAAPTVLALTEEQIDQRLLAREAERESKRLTKKHKDWQTVVGLPDPKTGQLPDTAYRRWLGTQPKEYQDEIAASIDHDEIADSITKFKATLAPTPQNKTGKVLSERERQLRAGVQPKGAGGPGVSSAATDEASAFKQAHAEEMKQLAP